MKYCMRLISCLYRYLFSLFTILLLPFSLCSDWNQDFDTESSRLFSEVIEFQKPEYRKVYDFFMSARRKLLSNKKLVAEIQSIKPNQRRMFKVKKHGIILKVRGENSINDMYPWELSILFDSHQFLAPAFPIEIGKRLVIIQPLIKFTFAKRNRSKVRKHPRILLEKVSLTNYWKSAITSYVLGFNDLYLRNIGITKKGVIIFFDNECCFHYPNTTERNQLSVPMGFVSQSFDWPHFLKPLNADQAKVIQKYLIHFSNFESKLNLYLKHRSLPLFKEGLLFRLQQLKAFQVDKGTTFRDFIEFIYPRLGKGLNDLRQIASKILGEKVGHGSSLFFINRRICNYALSDDEKPLIHEWITTYID